MGRMQAENKAQQIILRRSGAIVCNGNVSQPTENFIIHASKFRELRKQGFNFIQIEKEICHE